MKVPADWLGIFHYFDRNSTFSAAEDVTQPEKTATTEQLAPPDSFVGFSVKKQCVEVDICDADRPTYHVHVRRACACWVSPRWSRSGIVRTIGHEVQCFYMYLASLTPCTPHLRLGPSARSREKDGSTTRTVPSTSTDNIIFSTSTSLTRQSGILASSGATPCPLISSAGAISLTHLLLPRGGSIRTAASQVTDVAPIAHP